MPPLSRRGVFPRIGSDARIQRSRTGAAMQPLEPSGWDVHFSSKPPTARKGRLSRGRVVRTLEEVHLDIDSKPQSTGFLALFSPHQPSKISFSLALSLAITILLPCFRVVHTISASLSCFCIHCHLPCPALIFPSPSCSLRASRPAPCRSVREPVCGGATRPSALRSEVPLRRPTFSPQKLSPAVPLSLTKYLNDR
jgi:hypothetical protein